nr:hypothetical protein [Tanacetum cinerariifolium]
HQRRRDRRSDDAQHAPGPRLGDHRSHRAGKCQGPVPHSGVHLRLRYQKPRRQGAGRNRRHARARRENAHRRRRHHQRPGRAAAGHAVCHRVWDVFRQPLRGARASRPACPQRRGDELSPRYQGFAGVRRGNHYRPRHSAGPGGWRARAHPARIEQARHGNHPLVEIARRCEGDGRGSPAPPAIHRRAHRRLRHKL